MRKLYALTDNQAQFIKEKFPRAQIGNGIAPFTEAECDAFYHFMSFAEGTIDLGNSPYSGGANGGAVDDLVASASQWRARERGETKIFRLSKV